MTNAMTTMPKYESYKNSEIDWIGDIPSHWETIPNKRLFSIRKEIVGKKFSDFDLLSLTLKGIIKRDMDNPEGKFPAEFDTYQIVYKNDFVFCLFDVEETPRTVGLSEHYGMITGAYTVMRFIESVNPAYIEQLYIVMDQQKKFKSLYKGLRNTIPKDVFGCIKTPIPPKEEQEAIADFLDEKTKQIDEAIGIKQQQIALLKERKQIIIQNAVTKGLNPTAPMKDSGIDWIGDIPAHWDLLRLGSRFEERRTKVSDKDFAPLSVTKTGVVPQLESAAKTNDGDNRKLVKKGDFVINSRSDRKGSSGIAFQDGSVSLINTVLHPKEIHPTYCNYLLKSNGFVEEFYCMGHGIVADLWTTRYDEMSSIILGIPTLEEQKAIADFLDEKTKQIDEAMDLQQAQIDKLKEYKASLINSAVTGKIKVI